MTQRSHQNASLTISLPSSAPFLTAILTLCKLPTPAHPGRIAVFIPAWDESAVIADMLGATIRRWGKADFRIFVGYYANDPLTKAAIGQVDDPRIEAVLVEDEGPTTKADCLNRLYDALLAAECRGIM